MEMKARECQDIYIRVFIFANTHKIKIYFVPRLKELCLSSKQLEAGSSWEEGYWLVSSSG